ncbi:MAG: DinB family protein [Ancalomicrobiaceae bacterium]|nr:DinB family protein [Ancalomicrobiaceae bacterium]
MLAHFRMFARYNAWANRLVYDAAAVLSDADYRSDQGAFFKSLNGTFNHLLVADRIWMRRFTGEGPQPTALDQILHDDFASLRQARVAEDARIVGFFDRLTIEQAAANMSYRSLLAAASATTQPMAEAILHCFNHQTHHRGQVHMILTRLTGEAPALDLAIYQRRRGMGLA